MLQIAKFQCSVCDMLRQLKARAGNRVKEAAPVTDTA
nr:MAG TPA: Rubredoxin-H...S-Fe hydrogen bond, ELECTRON TRANSPORT.86A [Caudoviricetes sp.]